MRGRQHACGAQEQAAEPEIRNRSRKAQRRAAAPASHARQEDGAGAGPEGQAQDQEQKTAFRRRHGQLGRPQPAAGTQRERHQPAAPQPIAASWAGGGRAPADSGDQRASNAASPGLQRQTGQQREDHHAGPQAGREESGGTSMEARDTARRRQRRSRQGGAWAGARTEGHQAESRERGKNEAATGENRKKVGATALPKVEQTRASCRLAAGSVQRRGRGRSGLRREGRDTTGAESPSTDSTGQRVARGREAGDNNAARAGAGRARALVRRGHRRSKRGHSEAEGRGTGGPRYRRSTGPMRQVRREATVPRAEGCGRRQGPAREEGHERTTAAWRRVSGGQRPPRSRSDEWRVPGTSAKPGGNRHAGRQLRERKSPARKETRNGRPAGAQSKQADARAGTGGPCAAPIRRRAAGGLAGDRAWKQRGHPGARRARGHGQTGRHRRRGARRPENTGGQRAGPRLRGGREATRVPSGKCQTKPRSGEDRRPEARPSVQPGPDGPGSRHQKST